MLYVLRGISASGKTTYANTLDAVRVNRDDIRRELTGRLEKFAGDQQFEAKVTRIEKDRVRELLVARKDVVIDDTNLHQKTVREWLNMAHDYGHEYDVITFDVDVETAIERDAAREYPVGEAVIRKQASRVNGWPAASADPDHPFVDWTPVEYDPNLIQAVTCDLDGTLALCSPNFNVYDPAHFPHDKLNSGVAQVVDLIADHRTVHYLTGRGEEHRAATEKWLHDNMMDFTASRLFMRKAGDKRRDDVVKVEMFNENIRGKHNVFAHFDDRDRVTKALRAIGLTVMQVAEGDF